MLKISLERKFCKLNPFCFILLYLFFFNLFRFIYMCQVRAWFAKISLKDQEADFFVPGS